MKKLGSSVIVLLLVAVGMGVFTQERTEGDRRPSCERFRLVLLTGMAVANPDYYLHWPAYSSNQACFAKEYDMPFLPWVGLSPRLLTVDPLRPMYTADFSTGRAVADLGPWRMTEGIKSLGDPQRRPLKAETTEQLKRMGSGLTVKAVVRLAKPMNEDEVRDIASNPEVFLYAPRDEAKPISWDSGSSGNTCAGLRGFDFCAEARSATDSFQKWVSMLRSGDESALENLGLSLPELQEQAADMRVHGIIVWDSSQAMLRILSEPNVSAMSIADMQVFE
ncbi:hypothetical protein HCN51_12940 [Nonomuraea sp. FMUSA5-5]|uniref:Uncharacterized protein n=1 Tax=Nonomuraea composti TaxID=2720023 RepID=A0ABX1B3L2_9ACTN|nr:hypothetical protein [Nonomuraea sp. FMUSA5-5]NJP90346.1 hypothetical protein [Nonomuraea sp. FMUSA5-5]